MYAGKPIIGIAGGIGSGKSLVAGLLGELGCCVISADELVRELYERAEVAEQLVGWWGRGIVDPRGRVKKKEIAKIIFNQPEEKLRLERLLHPMVESLRQLRMQQASQSAQVKAFVWDIPLLFEVGLHRLCDAVIFVDAPISQRLARVRQSRQWDQAELTRRENLQMPLDRKREIAEYTVNNTADVEDTGRQVRQVFSQILSNVR